MTTLYWGPHTCAIGIHVLLEEIGAPYDTVKLDAAGGETHKPPFIEINPKGKVPTIIRDDGTVLTEYGAIARWLATTFPDAGLLPDDREHEIRAMEMMDYTVGTVHGQGFARMFLPARFEPNDPVHATLGLGAGNVKQQGRTMVEQGFAILEKQLGTRDFAGGDRFGIADSALFYVERWAAEEGVDLPPQLAGHFSRMKLRPAVRRVMELWGEA
ncbi:glutathione S-transferase family protein [Lichenicola sp.]|uniref:glutathione S-transferase family protein n=1 Tax=Lichenicola sp. TaxID=2804529 RepID=UPI003AFFF095